MKSRRKLVFLIAVISGGTAAYISVNTASEPTIIKQMVEVAVAPKTEMQTIVAAAMPLTYGTKIKPEHLVEVEWPADSVPDGVFASKSEILEGKTGQRMVLSSIAKNEPIFVKKITGPGQRSTLSALLEKGTKAITIRVDDVAGVAGFIMPSDMVDILVTRSRSGDMPNAGFSARGGNNGNAGGAEQTFTDVLIQSVKVIAVDQLADNQMQGPSVARAVTVQVSIKQAQKVALAASVGKLSLALRPYGSVIGESVQRITLSDLSRKSTMGGTGPYPVMVGITRGVETIEYSVPRRSALN